MDRNKLVAITSSVLVGLLGVIVAFQQFEIASLKTKNCDFGLQLELKEQEIAHLNSSYFQLLTILQMLCEEEVFVLAPNSVCCEVWKGFNDDGVGESNFTDYRFRMWINDTSGGWALSKVCRGLMPHGWGLRYAPIKEIELSEISSFDVELDITLKLIDYKNYTVDNSSMNIAICLFFDGYKTDYQQSCYQTEMQFFSYYGDRIQKNQTWYIPWRNDSVAQFKLADNLQKGEIKHYEISLKPYFLDMMNHYNLTKAKLKHIEIFTEAYKGYCEFEVYDCKIKIST